MLSLLSSISYKYLIMGVSIIAVCVSLYTMNQARINANLRADAAQQQLLTATEFNDSLKQTIIQLQQDANKSSEAVASEMKEMRSRLVTYEQIKKGIKDEKGCVGPAVSSAIIGLRGNKNGASN